MALQYNKGALGSGASGTTATHAGYNLSGASDRVLLAVRVVAGTTLTWKFQACFDPASVTDANADWFDIATMPIDSTTPTTYVTSTTKTATGDYVSVIDDRIQVARIRLVTSANTLCTYAADVIEAQH